MALTLAKVTAGHSEEERYEFSQDCIDKGKVPISFKHPEGNPIDDGDINSTEDIEDISSDKLAEKYKEAILGNYPEYTSYEDYRESEHDPVDVYHAANQIVKFRDLDPSTPIFLYLGDNTVGRIGVIKNDYELDVGGYFDDKYGYPHIRNVDWIETPANIDRKEFFPEAIQNFLAHPATLHTLDVQRNSETHRLLQLCYGIGNALSESDNAKLEALLF